MQLLQNKFGTNHLGRVDLGAVGGLTMFPISSYTVLTEKVWEPLPYKMALLH